MASGHPGEAVRQIGRLFRDGAVGGLADGELLGRFAAGRGEAAEAAFEALVTRHGPMVHRACRGLLRDPNDVDDAFQATFLVLVRRAGSIDGRDPLGPWLHGVALRVARKARSVAARRRGREGGIAGDPPAAEGEATCLDLRPALHEELGRLPEKYRRPIVLCHLQGLTHAEAARELAWPVGTVSVRLARARRLLRDRLARRGLTAGVASWGLGLAAETAPAAIPEALIRSTTMAARSIAAGKAVAAGMVPAGPAALAQGVLMMMLASRLRWLIVPLALGVGAAGGALAARGSWSISEDRPEGASSELDPVPPGFFDVGPLATKDGSGPAPVREGQTLVVEVLEALPGRPITGERVVRPDGTVGLGFYGDLPVAGLNRRQIKVKVIEHLRRYLNDEVLGLIRLDGKTGKSEAVPPVESNRVFVDDVVPTPGGGRKVDGPVEDPRLRELGAQVGEIGGKLDRALKELEELRRERHQPEPGDGAKTPPR